ncbi:MAG: sugar ABC transporter permease [Gammaproteobacteria bacterium]
MSIVAQGTPQDLTEIPAPKSGAMSLVLHPVALGTLLGSLLAILLSQWFLSQARTELAEDAWNRDVIIELSALADAVAALDARDPKTSPEEIQAILPQIAAASADGTQLRAMRLSGARLLASTDARDSAEKPLPRRLARDEKWFFDLAQGIRASVETNRDEGVSRRRHIEVEELADGRLRITAPYFIDGQMAGVVQTERIRPGLEAGASWLFASLMLLLPYLVVLGVLGLAGSKRRDVDVAMQKPWALFFAAALALSLAFAIYAFQGLNSARSFQGDLTRHLAGEFVQMRDLVGKLAGGSGVSVAPGPDNSWDVDLFQRPMGVIDDQGEIDQQVLDLRLDERAEAMRGGLIGNWVLGIVVLGFVGLGYGRRLRRTVRQHRYAYFYVTPAIFAMMILVFFPFFYGVTLSFTEQTVLNVSEPLTDLFVGLANYIHILGDFQVFQSTAEGAVIDYQNFYWTLFITICWTVLNVGLGVTFGMLLALALNTKGLRFTNFYRVILILPWAIPNYITALIWKGMFHQQFGVINQAIQMFGGEPVAWFDGVFSSFMTGLITNSWLSFPFMMVVILGGLQSISQDMYEAATVEGATRWQQFKHITLPSLKPTIIPAVIISVVWTFNMFNVIYLVSGGEPAGANEILITKSYKIAFEEYRYGYAAAYSVVIFAILLMYGVFQTKVTKATEANA